MQRNVCNETELSCMLQKSHILENREWQDCSRLEETQKACQEKAGEILGQVLLTLGSQQWSLNMDWRMENVVVSKMDHSGMTKVKDRIQPSTTASL